MYPKKANIHIDISIPINNLFSEFQLESFKTEGFKEDDIINRIEREIRDRIWNNILWDFIPENCIKISYE